MKIAIYGGGAIGGHLAVRLALAGNDVSVVARGAQLHAIVERGLLLETGDLTLQARPRASDDPSHFGPQDIVFVTVKATGLQGVAKGLAPLVGPQTNVVFAQNGMPWWYPIALPAWHGPLPPLALFDLQAPFMDRMRIDQIVPAVVYSANEVLSPGIVRNNSPQTNAIEIAALTPASAAGVDDLRRMLRAAQVDSPVVDDIRAAVWLKLIANASASSLAVANRNPAAIALDPQIRQTFLRLIAECLAVSSALGFDLEHRIDVSRWTDRPQHHKPSLLQDFEQLKAMELEEIVLAPLAFARATGVATPTLDAVAAIVRRLAIDRGLYGERPDAMSTLPAMTGARPRSG